MYKGAILDLDVVLFPTTTYIEELLPYTVEAMIQAGLPAKKEDALERLKAIREERGSNAGNHFNLLCGSYCHDSPSEEIIQAGVSAYHTHRDRLFVPQEDTNEFLDFLVANEFRRCVVTCGLEEKQLFKLHKLEIIEHFSLTYEADTVIRNFVYILENSENKLEGKKELALQAIKEAELDPKRSFVVDDRPYGIVAAKQAGIEYAFKMKRGKYKDEDYDSWVDNKFRYNAEVENLLELVDVLIEFNLAIKVITKN